MTTKNTRVVSPHNVAFYLGVNPSLLMTVGPKNRRSTDNQIKSPTPLPGKRVSVTKFKFRSESMESEKIDASIHSPQKGAGDTSISPCHKGMTESALSFITPRKGLELAKSKTETMDPSHEQSMASEGLKQRIIENESLRSEVFRLETELRTYKRLKSSSDIDIEIPTNTNVSNKEFKDILGSLDELLNKSKQAYSNIDKKCKKLEELIVLIESGVLCSYKGPELQSLTDFLRGLTKDFRPASELEIEASLKTREVVRKKLEIAGLNTRLQKQQSKNEVLQQDLSMLRHSLKAGHVEKNVVSRSLTKEKSLNRDTQKKLGELQKTLEVITEGQQQIQQQQTPQQPRLSLPTEIEVNSNVSLVAGRGSPIRGSPVRQITESQLFGLGFAEKDASTNKLREALTKLVKQNEDLRRVIHGKDKKILKLEDSLSKTAWKLDKANNRMEKLRNQKTSHRANDGTLDEDDIHVMYSRNNPNGNKKPVDDKALEAQRGFPKSLDFRFDCFGDKYVELINDVLEGGSQAFSEHVKMLKSEEEIKEEVALISNQFISYRNFAEKMNRLLTECCTLFSLENINGVMSHIHQNIKQIMGAGRVRLWVNDYMTGTFRTMEAQDRELRCLLNKGVVAELIKTSSPILKRSNDGAYALMETIHPSGKSRLEKGHTCLAIPLKDKEKQIIGFLEITNFHAEAFVLDIEYFAQALGDVCTTIYERVTREKGITTDLKLKEKFIDAFLDLSASTSKRQFCEKVEEWVAGIFQCPGARYVIVDDNLDILKFSQEASPRVFNQNMGIIGKVVAQKKPFIALEASRSPMHSENVDLSTTLPLYTTPVILRESRNKEYKETIIGVLQIVISQKSFVSEISVDNSFANHAKSLDPNTENLLLKFTKLMGLAYDMMMQKIVGDGIVMKAEEGKAH